MAVKPVRVDDTTAILADFRFEDARKHRQHNNHCQDEEKAAHFILPFRFLSCLPVEKSLDFYYV
jgi:hypothetical protein